MYYVASIKYQVLILLIGLFMVLGASNALAHVTVKPAEVGVGQRLNFTVSVPTEEDNPTVEVRLVIPQGLKSVRPNAKPGWNIEIKKAGESMKGPVLNTGQPAPDPETITEIIWSGGSIPAEMRDEFIFSAQAPTEETELIWLAYQTYSDGTVVAWENDSKTIEEYQKSNPNAGEDDHGAPQPYSVTKIVNDLKTGAKPESQSIVTDDKVSGNNMPLLLSGLAVVLSGLSLGIALRKKS